MIKKYFLLLWVVCLVFSFGCGSKKPAGMPKVYPVKLTVMDGDTPLADATVILVSDNPVDNVVVGGTSNASGVVDLRTSFASYSEKGAPLGSYKITVQKDQPIVETKTQEEIRQMGPGELAEHGRKLLAERNAKPKLVPAIVTRSATTPLKIEVVEKGTDHTIDLSSYPK